jgi:RNA polymerase sigma factor for flagellar operon FliA
VDEGERRRLVQDHLALARSVAIRVKREIAPPVELDDLIGYATQGLLEAADRFDAGLGVAFARFAYYRMRGAVYDGLRRFGHLPKAEYAKVKAAQRATAYLANLADREQGAASDQGPAVAGLTVEDHLRAFHEAAQGVVTSWVTSLEALREEGLQIPDEGRLPEEQAAVAELGDRLRRAIRELPERERRFIEQHYFEDKPLQDVGAELGFTKSWASRLHARALDLLRQKLEEVDRPPATAAPARR